MHPRIQIKNPHALFISDFLIFTFFNFLEILLCKSVVCQISYPKYFSNCQLFLCQIILCIEYKNVYAVGHFSLHICQKVLFKLEFQFVL